MHDKIIEGLQFNLIISLCGWVLARLRLNSIFHIFFVKRIIKHAQFFFGPTATLSNRKFSNHTHFTCYDHYCMHIKEACFALNAPQPLKPCDVNGRLVP